MASLWWLAMASSRLVAWCVCVATWYGTASSSTASSSTASSSTAKTAFFSRRPGLLWDDCLEPLQVSHRRCSMLCLSTPKCLGFNFQYTSAIEIHNGDMVTISQSPQVCRLCLANVTKTLSTTASQGADANSLHFRYDTAAFAPAGGMDTFYHLSLPNGLLDGQVFVMHTKPTSQDYIGVLFHDSTQYYGTSKPENDLMVAIEFNTTMRPYTIALDNYNEATASWAGPFIAKPVTDYLQVGVESDLFILVNQATYTIYFDGKLFCAYPRSQRKLLSEIISVNATCLISAVYTTLNP